MARREPSPMVNVERSPSHSWWWDSHNSPKHSKWLHSNLQELDEKVKLMLKLVEEDADSFAQRAEMYYQKRPELVNLIEEFYRAYRSLAERYDHLTGEIRQNIPRALQVQFGLSCDSPKSMGPGSCGGRHHYSPLRRSNHMFERLLKKACELEDLKRDRSHADERGDEVHGNGTNDVCVENLGVDDPCLASHHNSSDGGSSLSSSDSEVDNMTPLERLRQEIDDLKETNNVLQKKIKHLEDENHGKQNDADALACRVEELTSELLRLKQQEFLIGVGLVPSEKEPQVEYIPSKEERHGFSSGEEDYAGELEEDTCGSEGRSLNNSLQSMQDQLDWLAEENRMQKLAILERAEEKREAIRQLCFSMDLLESKNQRLEEMLGVLKKRLNAASVAAAGRPSSAWKHLFSFGDWRVFKATQPFTAIAL